MLIKQTAAGGTPCALSDREIEVLRAWLTSNSKREVAAALFITECTVQTHLVRIREKYAAAGRPASSKVALFVRAVEDGFCSIREVAREINRREVVLVGDIRSVAG